MNTRNALPPLLRSALLALPLVATACGGGGGGGGSSSAPLGAFTSNGRALALDADDLSVRDVVGSPEPQTLGAFARDARRDLTYVIESDRNMLLRIDDGGRVTEVGPVDTAPGSMVFDPATDMLIGIRAGSLLRPSELIHIDPRTGAAEVVAETTRARALTLDPALNRLLGILVTSAGATSNTLVEVDPRTGESSVLFDHVTLQSVMGLAYDPVTRLLYGVDRYQQAALLTFDLTTQLLESAKQTDRPLSQVVLDDDTGRFFGLSAGGEVVSLQVDPQQPEVEVDVMVTLSRRLTGLAFDPADDRFFAIDVQNNELVKVDPKTGRVRAIARFPLGGNGFFRSLRTLAYDPALRELYTVDGVDGELLFVDPVTAACTRVGHTVGSRTVLAMDQGGGRLYGFDDAVDVVIEIDPHAPEVYLLDNLTGLTKVEDLAWNPNTQRLVALHEGPGHAGTPKVSSIALSSTNTSPEPELDAPAGLHGLGRDARTGLFHAFGTGHPQYELELDVQPGVERMRSLRGPWRAGFLAALTVPSHGVVYAIDRDGLYSWDAGAESMTRLGNLPAGSATDLVFDADTDHLGLRHQGEIVWIRPNTPWLPQGGGTVVSGASDLCITSDPAGTRVFGVQGGALHHVALGTTATTRLTANPRAGFTAEAAAYSPSADAVFALGRDAGTSKDVVVRFDVVTGDWADVGPADGSLRALFAN